MKDGEIDPFNIDVDTNQGAALPLGAEPYARGTDGVKRVRNLIKVEGT